MECEAFVIGGQLKGERLKAGLTQEQLADRIGTRKVLFPGWKEDVPILPARPAFPSTNKPEIVDGTFQNSIPSMKSADFVDGLWKKLLDIIYLLIMFASGIDKSRPRTYLYLLQEARKSANFKVHDRNRAPRRIVAVSCCT